MEKRRLRYAGQALLVFVALVAVGWAWNAWHRAPPGYDRIRVGMDKEEAVAVLEGNGYVLVIGPWPTDLISRGSLEEAHLFVFRRGRCGPVIKLTIGLSDGRVAAKGYRTVVDSFLDTAEGWVK